MHSKDKYLKSTAFVLTDAITPNAQRILSRLKMRHLAMLKNIEVHGSLTRVARVMGVSQPAITKALVEVESLFGSPLFIRVGRSLRPTAVGELAMTKASRMIQELDHWGEEMEAVRKGRTARLYVGASPYVSGALLTQAIAELYERHNVLIAIRQASSDQLVHLLCEHELDCVLGRSTAVAGHHSLQHEILYSQRPVLVGHINLCKRLVSRKLKWDQLAAMNWILPSFETPVGRTVSELFTHMQVPAPLPVIETYSIEVIYGIIRKNEGIISVVPDGIAQDMVRRGDIGILPWKMEWELPALSFIRRIRAMPLEAEENFAHILRSLCERAEF